MMDAKIKKGLIEVMIIERNSLSHV